MPEKQREAGAPDAVELPAAYCQGGFVQLRSIIPQTDVPGSHGETIPASSSEEPVLE
jgi:hypothetical protein